jgi:hypothetical protein
MAAEAIAFVTGANLPSALAHVTDCAARKTAARP